MDTILVAGGAGYVGSHTIIRLVEEGFNVVLVDNFSNATPLVIPAMEAIVGKKIKTYAIDLCDIGELRNIFTENKIDAVMNFAGLKSVAESFQLPVNYYYTNLTIMLNLLHVMEEYGVYRLVFSSSATVYGNPVKLPIEESDLLEPINTYGKTKKMIEDILQEIVQLEKRWRFISLRFFNPLGAHKSGNLGEDPNGTPTNLAPYITQTLTGKLDRMQVFGNDFNTLDGTTVRDYMHIDDLAKGHVAGLNYLLDGDRTNTGFEAVNLGSGKGFSVLELIQSFERASGEKIPYEVIERRPGDVDKSVASIEKAKVLLHWEPTYSIQEMCEDTWNWQRKHPNGYLDE